MVKVITIGCRLNQAEGDQLLRLPCETEIDKLRLDKSETVYIINTCAVTKQAVRTSWKTINRHLNEKNKNPNCRLIVTGCLATIEQEKLLNTPGIDTVVNQNDKIVLIDNAELIEHFNNSNRSRPVIKIQDGCPNDCSFCIAHMIRGKPKSANPEEITIEINRLVNLGYQEIVLTGLNLGAYGIDINMSLVDLLKPVNSDSFRVRLSSIEPDTITDEFLSLWQDKNLCRHLHIPMQSGDDRILKLMGRKNTTNDYRKVIDNIYSKIPDINIGTDVIAGFPTEDEEAFLNTLKLVQELPFGYLHVFPYSKRPGTRASHMPDTINREEKHRRVKALREISLRKKENFAKRYKGCTMEVLVEENNKGITDNYIHVSVKQNTDVIKGQLYNIRL